MLLAGVDENGLGPGLGPLVVTAVAVELPGADLAGATLERLGLPSELGDSQGRLQAEPALLRQGRVGRHGGPALGRS